jgi:hypothetical protein
VSQKQLTAHLQVDRYGAFRLTDAIRPSLDLQIVPREGFRMDTYSNPKAGIRVPVLAAQVSREKLFDAFLSLLEPLGEEVDVVLETSHESKGGSHRDLHREQIEMPVLTSYLCEYEDLLTNDGCTGIAVIGRNEPMEVQFDEHKLLVVYAHDLERFESILRQWRVPRDNRMKLLTEGEHLHSTDTRHAEAFEQLSYRLGTFVPAERVNW